MGGGKDLCGWGRYFQVIVFFCSIYAASSPRNHIDSKFYSKGHHENTRSVKYQAYNYQCNFEVLGSPLHLRPIAGAAAPGHHGRARRALSKGGGELDDATTPVTIANTTKCAILTYQVIILIVKCAGDIESNPGPIQCFERNDNHELNYSYCAKNITPTGGTAHYMI